MKIYGGVRRGTRNKRLIKCWLWSISPFWLPNWNTAIIQQLMQWYKEQLIKFGGDLDHNDDATSRLPAK